MVMEEKAEIGDGGKGRLAERMVSFKRMAAVEQTVLWLLATFV